MTDLARTNADNLENELADLPEKYKGKSITDVIRMHQESEQLNSRIGNELGEYRKIASTLADASLRPSKQVEEEKRPEVTTDDLFADPGKTLDDAIESHPAVRKARETSENLERQLAQSNFEKHNPSFKEDIADPEFAKWVKANPSLMKLAGRADAYDFEAAGELFGLWSEKKAIKQTVQSEAKKVVEKQKKEKDGTLEGSTGADASSEVIISRAEMRLLQQKALNGDRAAKAKWEDPKFQKMRRQAYLDGRTS